MVFFAYHTCSDNRTKVMGHRPRYLFSFTTYAKVTAAIPFAELSETCACGVFFISQRRPSYDNDCIQSSNIGKCRGLHKTLCCLRGNGASLVRSFIDHHLEHMQCLECDAHLILPIRQIFPLCPPPVLTNSSTNFSASTAKATMFADRLLPRPVFKSLPRVSFSLTTARAT